MADIYTPNLPEYNITTQPVNYQSQYNLSSPFGKILDQLGKNLTSQAAFTKTMPFADYAAPYREQAKVFTESTLRPQFERYQLNPFTRQQSAQAAAGGGRMMGSTAGRFADSMNQLYMQSYYPQQMQIQNYFEGLARDLYNQLGGQEYTSPIAFTNLGQ